MILFACFKKSAGVEVRGLYRVANDFDNFVEIRPPAQLPPVRERSDVTKSNLGSLRASKIPVVLHAKQETAVNSDETYDLKNAPVIKIPALPASPQPLSDHNGATNNGEFCDFFKFGYFSFFFLFCFQKFFRNSKLS